MGGGRFGGRLLSFLIKTFFFFFFHGYGFLFVAKFCFENPCKNFLVLCFLKPKKKGLKKRWGRGGTPLVPPNEEKKNNFLN